jgi:hypothetical protein
MKPIERGEVLDLAAYEAVRDRFRTRVIGEKKLRRVALGPQASCVFENRDTVLMQIQEMLRTERITREAAIAHEIETYNELIPKNRELSATILIEIEDKETRESFLQAAKGLEREFALVIDGHRCPGKNDPTREYPDRTTAVHYVKFDLSESAEQALRAVFAKQRSPETLAIDLTATHPKYTATTRLPGALVSSLAEDIA